MVVIVRIFKLVYGISRLVCLYYVVVTHVHSRVI